MRAATSKYNIPYLLMMVFVSPIISLFYLIKNTDWEIRKAFLILLVVLFGSTILLQESDGAVLKQMIYQHYIDLPFDQWFNEFIQILQFKKPVGTKGDIFNHVLSFIVGSILEMPEAYFIFVSAVYGYFFVKSLEKILNRPNLAKRSFLLSFILIIFITYRFVDNLQTVRTWTGLWVLFYGAYCYYETRKVKYLFIMLMAPLFHVAYFLMALPVYFSILLRKVNSYVLLSVYVASFFITVNQAAIVKQLSTTEIGQNKVNAYYDEEGEGSTEVKESTANFYVKYGKHWSQINCPHIMIGVLAFLGFFNKKKLSNIEYGLFCCALLLATLANFGSFIGAFYARTMSNAGIYITAMAALLALRGAFEISRSGGITIFQRNLLLTSLLTFIPYLLYIMANMLQFTSTYMLLFPVGGFFEDNNISVIQFLKQIF